MNALNPVMNIGDQIAEAVMLHDGLSKADALKRAGDLLELVEISRGRVANYPHEFSGGMKQRVMIAMALACNPKVVIGDEPTTALDVMVQAQILNLLEKLRKELNMGLILITHDLSILGETCDKIAVMYAGKIVESGTVADIFENAKHPYTKKAIGCFPNVEKEKNGFQTASKAHRQICCIRLQAAHSIRDAKWQQSNAGWKFHSRKKAGTSHQVACHLAEV